MGRGAEKETRRMVDEERARQGALNQQLLAEREQGRNTLLPQYQDILASPGLSDAEKSAVTQEGLGALGSAFDALTNRAENRVARTGNAAGFNELLDDLASVRGREEAGLARKNQIDFADEAFRRRMAALGGLGSIFGLDTNLLGRGLGIPAELLNVRANASRSGPGFWSSFGQGLGHSLGQGAGLFGLGG